MPPSLTLRKTISFKRGTMARKVIREGKTNESPQCAGQVPRISRLMALAIRFDGLITRGEITDQAELARLGNVSRARVTQIMNLLNLAPDIQEAILFLPLVTRGHDPIREHAVRPIAAVLDWGKQRRMWREVARKNVSESTVGAE